MSWIKSMAGGETPAGPTAAETAADPTIETIEDPNIPGRRVANKSANKPYLAHKKYRDGQTALHNAWLEKKKIHDAKIANGEKVGPLERDPTEEREVGLWDLLKFFTVVIAVVMLSGKLIQGSYTWDYEPKFTLIKSLWPTNQRLFSENALSAFDGTDNGRPVYVAIDGDVFDVSVNRATYGPGGSYNSMAGADTARSFATGCFKDHRTHDLRGLSEKELASIEHWKKFFGEHKEYFKVGRVVHRPIDPASPIPEHCDPKKRTATADTAAKPVPVKAHDHEEL